MRQLFPGKFSEYRKRKTSSHNTVYKLPQVGETVVSVIAEKVPFFCPQDKFREFSASLARLLDFSPTVFELPD